MTSASNSRRQILDRVRKATGGEALRVHSALERAYMRRGQMNAIDRLALFTERLREYDAEVKYCRAAEAAATIAAQLSASGRREFIAPQGLPSDWLAPGVDWKVDDHLGIHEIEKAEGVVTACFCAVADSGTIVLHHGAGEGRRVITLLPDWHLCVVRASQVVETLPEYFERCSDQKDAELPRCVTWISGPSATADIEMTRIKGVHGPRFLHVIVVHDEQTGSREQKESGSRPTQGENQ